MESNFEYFFVAWNAPEVFQAIVENNGNFLLSQYNNRNMITELIKYKKAHPEYKGKLFIDSGAFTVSTKGDKINIDEYINYVNGISDYIDIIAPLDVIPKDKYDRTEEASEINYMYMMSKLKHPEKLIPVFHEGEDWHYLEKILDYGKDYIALGALVGAGASQIDYFLNKAFHIIGDYEKKHNKKIKIHAFGMTSQRLLRSYPIHSADSTSHIMSAAKGSIMTPWGNILVSNVQKGLKSHIDNKNVGSREALQKYLDRIGISIDQMQGRERSYVYRTVANVYYILDFCRDYKYENRIKAPKPFF